MLGRGSTRSGLSMVQEGRRQGLASGAENYDLSHRPWREEVLDWEGGSRFRSPPGGLRARVRRGRPVRGSDRAGIGPEIA